MHEERFRAMNTDIVLAAEGEERDARAGFIAARQFIESSEKRFSRFLETSELSRLNRSAGEPFSASAELYEIIETALGFVEATGGLFDPAILTALRQAGYDRSLEKLQVTDALPARPTLTGQSPDVRGIRLEPEERQIWLPPETTLDLGGIAKGWIAERAAGILADYSSACGVNAGGDLFLHGLPAGETAWEIDLEDPRDPAKSLGVLHIAPGAVATSSITKRRWKQGEQEQHHLIDPRTGRPAETPWLSVTVYAAHAAAAEVWAKTILIAGPLDAIGLLRSSAQMDWAFIAVDRNGRLWSSQNAQEVFNVGIQSYA